MAILLHNDRLQTKLCLSDCNWTWIHNHLVHKRTVWPNGWGFVYELSGCGFEPSCSHLNFRFRACFEQGIPWHSGNYRVWIHPETRTWHDKDIQSWYFIFNYFNMICGKVFFPEFSKEFVHYVPYCFFSERRTFI